MNHDFWVKTTNYKLFGFNIFQKNEICKETEYEGETLKVYVSPEYYKAEFEEKDNGGRLGNDTN